MFKYENCEKNLFVNMQNKLASKNTTNKLIKAMELISYASEVFDASGMSKESEELVCILEKIAKKNDIKHSIKQLLKNMENTGTPFAFDGSDLNDLNELDINDEDLYEINEINKELSELDFEDED